MIRRTLSWPRGSGTCIRKGIRTGPASSGSCGTCRRKGTSPPGGGCAAWRGRRACSACIPGRRRGRPCRTAGQWAAWSIWWTRPSSPRRSRTSCGSAILRISGRILVSRTWRRLLTCARIRSSVVITFE